MSGGLPFAQVADPDEGICTMSRQELRTSARRCSLIAAAISALALSTLATAAPALEDLAAGVQVDPAQISVSGISSGGFMAHQFHVAHSQHIMGSGIVAGGPYYCARGNILDALTLSLIHISEPTRPY